MRDEQSGRTMAISSVWLQVAVLTFLVGFLILGLLARLIYTQHPPIPQRVVDAGGGVLFTGADIMAGQHLFQRRGLMQYGTLFGHGAYLGPDFTAQYLHRAAVAAIHHYETQGMAPADARAWVLREFKENRYAPETGTLRFTPGETYALGELRDFYTGWFGSPGSRVGLQRPRLTDPEDIRRLTAYFAWAAWVSAAALRTSCQTHH